MTSPSPVGRLRPPPDAPVDAARLRAVHRAVSELRRGTPVLLAGDDSSVLLAVETVGARGVGGTSRRWPPTPPVMLLAPARAAGGAAAAASPRVQAVAIQVARLPRRCRRSCAALADPTVEQQLSASCRSRQAAGAGAAGAGAGQAGAAAAGGAGRSGARRRGRGRAAGSACWRVAAADVLAYPSEARRPACGWPRPQVPLEDAPDARVIAFRSEGAGHRAPGHRRRRAGSRPRPAGAHPFRMFHRRPAGQPALRLRAAVARRDPPDGRGGRRRAAVPGAGGPRHRPGQQAAGLYAAGSRAGHAGRQPRAGLGCGRAQLPDRGPHAGGVGHRSGSGC